MDKEAIALKRYFYLIFDYIEDTIPHLTYYEFYTYSRTLPVSGN